MTDVLYRYNAFFILYPLGIGSEMWLVYLATGPAGKIRKEFEWGLYAILLLYVPGRRPRLGCDLLSTADGGGRRFLRSLHAHDGAAEEDHAWETTAANELSWVERVIVCLAQQQERHLGFTSTYIVVGDMTSTIACWTLYNTRDSPPDLQGG